MNQQGNFAPEETPGEPSSSSEPTPSADQTAFPGSAAAGGPGPTPPASLVSPASDVVSFNGTWITAAPSAEVHDVDASDFVFENGRRYHALSQRTMYPLPNDENEQERDDLKHQLFKFMMRDGALFYSPVDQKLRDGGWVYDLGTGTGTWPLELAEQYGNAQIYACDISPIQPEYVWPNVFFSVDDFEDDWVDFPENTFDFVHMRHAAWSVRDLPALLQRIFRHLKPGGYVEFHETSYWPRCDDSTLRDDTPYAFRDFCHYTRLGMRALGLDLDMVSRLPDALRAAGFIDATEVRHKCPIGPWARDQRQRERGMLHHLVLTDGLSGVAKRPLGAGLGWQPIQIEMFLVEVRKSLRTGNGVHAYFPYHVIYGKKPEA